MADSKTEQNVDYLNLLIGYFQSFHNNDTSDFQSPHFRKSVQYVYPLFIFLYALIILVGTVGNIYMMTTILKRRLYRDPTYYFICNLAISNLIKCILVLPITLANLLILNWLFGSFLCYFIPMMQNIPIHATMFTFLLITVDRYRLILYPMASRIPKFICSLGIWILSICIVLPFAIYITYLDLGAMFGPNLEGTGLCAVNVKDDIEEYLRGLFIVRYVLPLAVIAFLHVRISGEIKCRENFQSTVGLEISSTDVNSHSTIVSNSDSSSAGKVGAWSQCETPNSGHHDALTTTKDTSMNRGQHAGESSLQCHADISKDDGSFNPVKEKRTQKYLITMVTLFAMCMCPLEIMNLVRHIVVETYNNTGHFDLAYIIFIWIGFLSTCTTPILFASWTMGRSEKERVRGYLPFHSRSRRKCSTADDVCGSNLSERKRQQQASAKGHTNSGYVLSVGRQFQETNTGSQTLVVEAAPTEKVETDIAT